MSLKVYLLSWLDIPFILCFRELCLVAWNRNIGSKDQAVSLHFFGWKEMVKVEV